MGMLRKFIPLVLAGALTLGLLVSCGSSEETAEEETPSEESTMKVETSEKADKEDTYDEDVETEENIEEEEIAEEPAEVEEESEVIEQEEEAENVEFEEENNDDVDAVEESQEAEEEQVVEEPEEEQATTVQASELGIPYEDADQYVAYTIDSHDFDDINEVLDLVDIGVEQLFSDSDNFQYGTSCNSRYALVRYTYADDYINTVNIAVGARNGDTNSINLWNAIRNDLVSCSQSMDSLLSIADDDYHALVVVLNNENHSNALLAAYNGQIIYDVVVDG